MPDALAGVPLHRLGARAASAAIAQGHLTSERLVAALLERIAAREPAVHAWAHLDAAAALAAARAADAQAATGCLHGLPIGWKDVIDCAGLPTAHGAALPVAGPARGDAGAVAMARRAGALVLGKTVTTEFATSHPGPTTHPENPAHTPGGSSSGSAAAVANGMVPLAIGTQTGGSTIRPASFCGIVGFKPSFGLINRHGVRQVADSFDTVGTFARSVDDTALLVAGLTGRDDFLEIRPVRPASVTLSQGPEWDQAEPATVQALDDTLALLSRHGVAVRRARLPADFAGMTAAHHTIEYFELARALQPEYRAHRELLSAALLGRIEHGLATPAAEYEAALALRERCRGLIGAQFAGEHGADLLLGPAAPGEAPPGLATTGKAVFNRLWTALGMPAITLPGYRGPGGLPIGIQLIGPARHDARLLGHTLWLEALLAGGG